MVYTYILISSFFKV